MAMGGFTNTADFNTFMDRHHIDSIDGQYPIFKIMKSLNIERKTGIMTQDLDSALKSEKIKAQQISNMLKLKELISRRLAVDRMRTALNAIANKMRYSIKSVAPRLAGLLIVPDIENILINAYNDAIESIEKDAKSLVDWENYGIDFQPSGNGVATNTQSPAGSGSVPEDQILDEVEYTGETGPRVDSIFS